MIVGEVEVVYLKKAMLLLVVIFGGICILGSFPSVTSACSCVEAPSIEEEFEHSKAVFSGKVIDIKDEVSLKGYKSKSVLFEVTNTWKGIEQSQIIITTGQGHGDCGYDFSKGRDYLVYAKESIMYGGKSLVSVMCDRTDILSSSQEDLEVLGEGKPPTEEVDLSGHHDENQIYIWSTVALALGVGGVIVLNKRKKTTEFKQ